MSRKDIQNPIKFFAALQNTLLINKDIWTQLQLTYWRCTEQDAATRTDSWEKMEENGSTAAACFPWKNSKGHEQDNQLNVFCLFKF